MKDLQHDNLTKICMLRKILFVVSLTLLGSNFVDFFSFNFAVLNFFVHSKKGNYFIILYCYIFCVMVR